MTEHTDTTRPPESYSWHIPDIPDSTCNTVNVVCRGDECMSCDYYHGCSAAEISWAEAQRLIRERMLRDAERVWEWARGTADETAALDKFIAAARKLRESAPAPPWDEPLKAAESGMGSEYLSEAILRGALDDSAASGRVVACAEEYIRSAGGDDDGAHAALVAAARHFATRCEAAR